LVAAPYDNTVILTPMGVRYASNLTPDVETGIGAWSSGLFVDRMRASEHWTVYSNDSALYSWSGYYSLTDQDLRSIYEYLRTLPAVVNPVPGSQPIGDWEW
jgi:nicotinate dehydrogenase subunit B